ncbi:hypothetical protein ASPZODRAFT_1776819 [Penicilliopsis zonata CBS 506.65]|uniref:Nitrogen permease regulator 2 n=1 Tax=Penicilliopsis zonata CBS 506.65 TaxID=1073090 RepID=A0A1L9SKZ4_9EURO|nr:hypothetical protein ASPZODRAFT_1776819 [Penicilliopsis zonata CBS 506.65]OJJ47781.1 hypothetical protein ASPZODRAFT_1776819 [Penicilliopsis zonata CBS 506.65]
MIKAIFYSKFDTLEGPKVVHQVPDGAIVPSATAPSQPLFLTFSDISFFVIPRQELCGNLIQVCSNGYRILGYPICMSSPRYDRNEFIFNFCIVLAEEEDFSTYRSVVQKLADLMHGLEEQNGFLSRDFSKSGEGKVYSLCEMMMEDLNNYCECMIPIDELNTLNIKLFPSYHPPPPVKAWHVPLFTVRYHAFMDDNWDLTMQRIVPYINGVNSVRIISILANADFSLTCRAIRHLLYYGCLFILDIFSFSAIYAVTAQFNSTIASDEEMQQECARYVNTRFSPHHGLNIAPPTGPGSVGGPMSSSRNEMIPVISNGHHPDLDDVWPAIGDAVGETSTSSKGSINIGPESRDIVDGVGIVELYASLRQGQNVKQWYLQHSRQLANIDIRRFITFGIIKGFLYRVHKYAIATGNPAPPLKSEASTANNSQPVSSASTVRDGGAVSPYAGSVIDESGPIPGGMVTSRPVSDRGDGHSREPSASLRSGSRNGAPDEDEESIDDRALSKYLDGKHSFDQICTELQISEKELTGRLKRYHGEILIIHR